MWARTQLKIGWTDLAAGVGYSLLPGDRDALAAEIAGYWGRGEETLDAFSVRSGFDLLLHALALPAGSEIVFSALNVKGMINIAKRHGLVSVPLDLDVAHMAPQAADLARVVTPRTRLVVVAHLFGTRLDLEALAAVARENGLLFVEDCAQAFEGLDYEGHPQADVALFSFGPLKTATALGGALVRVADPALRQRMKEIQAAYPLQRRAAFFKRVVKFALLKAMTARPVFALIHRGFSAFGRSYEDSIADAVRGVAKLGSSKKLHVRPSVAMLRLLKRRLDHWDAAGLAERTRAGERLRDLLGAEVVQPGVTNGHHSYWVFPILTRAPGPLIEALRSAGFDGASLPRSQAVAAPEDRPELEPATASQAMRELVVLPCYAAMPARELERQAALVRRHAEPSGLATAEIEKTAAEKTAAE